MTYFLACKIHLIDKYGYFTNKFIYKKECTSAYNTDAFTCLKIIVAY